MPAMLTYPAIFRLPGRRCSLIKELFNVPLAAVVAIDEHLHVIAPQVRTFGGSHVSWLNW